ncbi:MAG: family transcriptional regulator, cyclic receptor protein [Abditibacteriota bacterium]|nr:family transcriptional regulator, cyclic receptor protein [Abditibacteriota bacterium]
MDVVYGYDHMGSRTSAVRNGGPSAGGTQSTFTHNPLNQIASLNVTNAQNQTTEHWFGYWGGNMANSGNNVDQSRVDYSWDDAERLREIVYKNAQGVNDRRSNFSPVSLGGTHSDGTLNSQSTLTPRSKVGRDATGSRIIVLPMKHSQNELEHISLFRGLTTGQLTMICGLLHRKSFATGTPILSMGQLGEAVYILVSGTVKICGERADGSDFVLAICGPGEVLGEMSALDGLGHSASVIALEPSVCLWINRPLFLDLLQTIPALSFNVTLNTMRRLRLATAHIQSLATQDVPGRVADRLLIFAREYGEPMPNGGTMIPFRLTQNDLADLIGASRERVNKALAFFKRQKYIAADRSHRITVHDRAALTQRTRNSSDV